MPSSFALRPTCGPRGHSSWQFFTPHQRHISKCASLSSSHSFFPTAAAAVARPPRRCCGSSARAACSRWTIGVATRASMQRALTGAQYVVSKSLRVSRQISSSGVRQVVSPRAPLQGQAGVSFAARPLRSFGPHGRHPHLFVVRLLSNSSASLIYCFLALCDWKARMSHAFAVCGFCRGVGADWGHFPVSCRIVFVAAF